MLQQKNTSYDLASTESFNGCLHRGHKKVPSFGINFHFCKNSIIATLFSQILNNFTKFNIFKDIILTFLKRAQNLNVKVIIRYFLFYSGQL